MTVFSCSTTFNVTDIILQTNENQIEAKFFSWQYFLYGKSHLFLSPEDYYFFLNITLNLEYFNTNIIINIIVSQP